MSIRKPDTISATPKHLHLGTSLIVAPRGPMTRPMSEESHSTGHKAKVRNRVRIIKDMKHARETRDVKYVMEHGKCIHACVEYIRGHVNCPT